MTDGKEVFVCSHMDCNTKVPGSHRDTLLPDGWTIGRIEEFHAKTITTYYIYLCPLHRLGSLERQSQLPFPTQGATL